MKHLKTKTKTRVKSRFVINRKSVCYEVVKLKVLNWTSKGRYLDSQRAPFAS